VVLEKLCQQGAHVVIVCVDLVDDQHLAPEACEAHRRVRRAQRANKGLVDRAHAEISKESALGRGRKPSNRRRIAWLQPRPALDEPHRLAMPRLAMRQHHIGLFSEHVADEGRFAPEGCVCRRHRGKANIDSVRTARRDETMRHQVGCLRFAGARHVLDDEQDGTGREPFVAQPLHRRLLEGDYFSAGEELNVLGRTGAAITSYAFFGGGIYYQHAVLDVALLARTLREEGRYGPEAVRDLVGRGVRVMLDGLTKVQPRGKRNSFASDTMASFALMDAGTGPTFNLALAFLDPVRPGERAKADAPFSYAERDALTVSVERLRNFHAVAREAYGITDPACAFAGPGAPRAGNSPPRPREGVGEVWTLPALHAFAEGEVARWWAAA
jgi:CT1975-like protein